VKYIETLYWEISRQTNSCDWSQGMVDYGTSQFRRLAIF